MILTLAGILIAISGIRQIIAIFQPDLRATIRMSMRLRPIQRSTLALA